MVLNWSFDLTFIGDSKEQLTSIFSCVSLIHLYCWWSYKETFCVVNKINWDQKENTFGYLNGIIYTSIQMQSIINYVFDLIKRYKKSQHNRVLYHYLSFQKEKKYSHYFERKPTLAVHHSIKRLYRQQLWIVHLALVLGFAHLIVEFVILEVIEFTSHNL